MDIRLPSNKMATYAISMNVKKLNRIAKKFKQRSAKKRMLPVVLFMGIIISFLVVVSFMLPIIMVYLYNKNKKSTITLITVILVVI